MSTKKENKIAYKQMKFRVGIYQITNKQNKKIFLKTSTDLDRAFNSDQFQLKLGSHKNIDLQNDWNIYGPESFEFGCFDELKIEETATDQDINNDLKELLEIHRAELLKNGAILY